MVGLKWDGNCEVAAISDRLAQTYHHVPTLEAEAFWDWVTKQKGWTGQKDFKPRESYCSYHALSGTNAITATLSWPVDGSGALPEAFEMQVVEAEG